MSEQKINQKTYEYVFDYISNQIISGELKLGDKIPTERDIAEELGVSRNSVREVMHMLEITGLIECVQGSGNYVRCQPDGYLKKSVHMVMALLKIDYTEIFHIRCGYEYTALKLAMKNASDEEIEELQSIVKKMDAQMSIKESAKLDTQFHNALMEASHNRILILYASMIQDLLDLFIENFRTRILADKRRAQALQKAHLGICDSLVNKDYEAGRMAMERHFEIVGEQVEKCMKGNKWTFTS